MQERGLRYFYPRGIEPAIAVARLLLALLIFFLALPLTNQQVGLFSTSVERIALIYIAYAVCAALLVWIPMTLPSRLPAATHVFDFLFFALFLGSSAGSTVSSDICFTSAVTSGAVRWRARGALITGIAGLGVYVGMILLDPNFELSRVISNAAQLAIVTLVLAYVGELIDAALDQKDRSAGMIDEAVRHERVRLARDLHDGVLQALTGLALQVARLAKFMDGEPAKARSMLGEIQEAVLAEQRAVRSVVEELRRDQTIEGFELNFAERLREVATRVAGQWDVRVDLEIAQNGPPLPQQLAREICHIAEESLVNAIRHGSAKDVRLEWRIADDCVNLRVAYAGRGFAMFRGQHDLDSLNQMKAGPRSLKQRVSELRGGLVINSGDNGAIVDIAVPLTPDVQCPAIQGEPPTALTRRPWRRFQTRSARMWRPPGSRRKVGGP